MRRGVGGHAAASRATGVGGVELETRFDGREREEMAPGADGWMAMWMCRKKSSRIAVREDDGSIQMYVSSGWVRRWCPFGQETRRETERVRKSRQLVGCCARCGVRRNVGTEYCITVSHYASDFPYPVSRFPGLEDYVTESPSCCRQHEGTRCGARAHTQAWSWLVARGSGAAAALSLIASAGWWSVDCWLLSGWLCWDEGQCTSSGWWVQIIVEMGEMRESGAAGWRRKAARRQVERAR